MKATHRDYLHRGHLRVETGDHYPAWSFGAGSFVRTAVCMAPSCSDFAKLNRSGLPSWPGGEIVDGVEKPRYGG